MFKHIRAVIYKRYLKPLSNHPDDQRREFIVNIIVGLFTTAALVAMISSTVNHLVGNSVGRGNSLYGTAVFLAVTYAMWAISRKGHYKVSASILVGLVWLASLQLMLAWSFELPMAQLVLVLAIVIAGIILSSTAAVVSSVISMLSVLVIGYMQVHGLLSTNTTWLTQPLEFSDAVGQAVILLIIGGVSWLANKEIDSLLQRAWRSEAALAKERDLLEVKVEQRTKELETSQLERIMELQHFAEFGRVSAGLLHDLANPLTAASLNLEQDASHSKLVGQAMASLRHIERYIVMARKQLQGKGMRQVFNASNEISQVVELLAHQARSANISLTFKPTQNDEIYGDPVAFHRVVANLIVNAIHAYDSKTSVKLKTILIQVVRGQNNIQVLIKDRGVGIKSQDLPHIFEEFYSTKKQVGRGLGIGLATAKAVIEQDFNGSITVSSNSLHGTLFTITLPLYESKNTTKSKSRNKISIQETTAKR